MMQGIKKNDLLCITEDLLQFVIPPFELDKTMISKNLLKSLYWAMSLP
jgi:hypothetical protein